MKKAVAVGLTTFALGLTVFAQDALAGDVPAAPKRSCESSWCEKVRTTRRIALRLDGVFRRYGSPLAGYGVEHVRSGRRWNVSPFFMAVASGIESTFAREACGYNAWGWGSCSMGFSSWRSGIEFTARRMRELMNHGLRDMYEFGAVYCPPCGSGWGSRQASWQRSIFHVRPSMTFAQAESSMR